MEKLKKCPFCGGEAQMCAGSSKGEIAWVYCEKCGAESGTRDTAEKAAEAWNRRVNEWLIL